MNKKIRDNKNVEIATSDDYDENEDFHWNLYSPNNEELCYEEKTEILWSREQKHFFSENDFFKNDHDSFSDLTERSTSSCSWHNDDFDMKSSNKVSKSLEAVDDALYENLRSPFISEEVFQECCDWSNKFPYFRLKGEQIVKPIDDSVVHYKSDQKSTLSARFEKPSLCLQVEGKKMALHTPDKSCKKTSQETVPDADPVDFFEEIVACDDGYEECFVLSKGETETISEKLVEDDAETTALLKSLQEKVIERLAQHAWPKVLEILQASKVNEKCDKSEEGLQLPPIISALVEHKQCIPSQRPKTEGTHLSMIDFPELSSILSVSPKVLQDRKDCRSGKSSLRSSRPNSEIHLSRRSNTLSAHNYRNNFQKVPGPSRTTYTTRPMQFVSKKGFKRDEKDSDKVSVYLPALEEDIADPADYLRGFSLQNEAKNISRSVISHFPQKPECFLPPIDTDDNINSDLKLTRNLFTFFGSDLKYSNRSELVHKPKTPASRPNTSASRKGGRQYDSFKFFTDFSSINNSSHAETRRIGDNSEKQVTLFPIVTSIVPSKERSSSSAKKSFLNTISGRKR